MPEPWLVCEGPTDLAVLSAVFDAVLGAGITLRAAGGESGLGAVADYIGQSPGVTVAYVRDRDYRTREAVDAAFGPGGREFIWRRHSIENYLCQPQVLAAGLAAFRASLSGLPKGQHDWASQLPGEPGELREGLLWSAKRIAPREAARMAFWSLRSECNQAGYPALLRMPEFAGDSEELCREALVTEAQQFLAAAAAASTFEAVAPAAVRGRFDGALTRVSAAPYQQAETFLEEFNGRDLIAQLQRWLRETRQISQVSQENLLEGARGVVAEVYRENRNVFGGDDFLDLANGVRSLAGLTPVA